MGGVFRQRPNDHANSFDGHDFDGRALLDQRPFTDHVDAPTADQGGARRTQLGESGARLMKQIGLLGTDFADDPFGDENAAESAVGKQLGPEAKTPNQPGDDSEKTPG